MDRRAFIILSGTAIVTSYTAVALVTPKTIDTTFAAGPSKVKGKAEFRTIKSASGEHSTGNTAKEEDVIFETESGAIRINWKAIANGGGSRVRLRVYKWEPKLSKIRDKWHQKDVLANASGTQGGYRTYQLGPGKFKVEVWCKRAKYEVVAQEMVE